MTKTVTRAPYRVRFQTENGITETAHRTLNDAAIVIQILHADALKNGYQANIELRDVREEVSAW